MNWRKYCILLLTVILLCTLAGGCSQKQSPQKKPQTDENRPKAPTVLNTMKSEIEKVNEELDKKIKLKREQDMQPTQGQSSGGAKSGSQQGSEQGSQTSGGQSANTTDKTKDFKNEQKMVERLHQEWNNLEPEAIKAGLNPAGQDEFEKALDELTKNIYGQKLEESRLSAIGMYKVFARVSALFATPVPPDFYKVKYEAMTAAALAESQTWDKAGEHLKPLEEQWDSLKSQAKQVDASMIMKTDLAVTDLKKAIESKEKDLVSIKSDILKNNLKKMEEKLSKKM